MKRFEDYLVDLSDISGISPEDLEKDDPEGRRELIRLLLERIATTEREICQTKELYADSAWSRCLKRDTLVSRSQLAEGISRISRLEESLVVHIQQFLELDEVYEGFFPGYWDDATLEEERTRNWKRLKDLTGYE